MMEYLYRYDSVCYSNGVDEFDNPYHGHTLRVQLSLYHITKRTPCGVWISWGVKDKFVNLNANKQFACPTEDEAMESFKRRKRRQISILRAQLLDAEQSLVLAESGKTDREHCFLGFEIAAPQG